MKKIKRRARIKGADLIDKAIHRAIRDAPVFPKITPAMVQAGITRFSVYACLGPKLWRRSQMETMVEDIYTVMFRAGLKKSKKKGKK